jgi:diguanylate cyclase (GGDEF)-like protein/PAS domain S-box-containing protein
MESYVSNKRVTFVILSLFIITFFIYIYSIANVKYNDINFITEDIDKKINKVFNKSLKNSNRLFNIYMNKISSKIFINFIENRNKKSAKKFLNPIYKEIKYEMPMFKVLKVFYPNGEIFVSIDEFNENKKNISHGDFNLKDILLNPKEKAFFDFSNNGLFLKYIRPIYKDKKLIAFAELGIRPKSIIKNILDILDVKGYFFIDKNIMSQYTKEKFIQYKNYSICKYCNKSDEFIENAVNDKLLKNGYEYQYRDNIYIVKIKTLKDYSDNSLGKILYFIDITDMYKQYIVTIKDILIIFLVVIILIYMILNRYIKSTLKKAYKAKQFIDSVNDALYLVDLKTASILDVNHRATTMLGYSYEELLTKKVQDIRKPIGNERFKWKEHVENLRAKKHVLIRGVHIREDNTEFPVESSLSYMKDGDEEYMISVVRDISNQIKMEKEIYKKNFELDRLGRVVSKKVLYTTSDLNGNITDISDAMLELTGYKKEDVIGKNHSIFRGEYATPEVFQHMWHEIKRNKIWNGELRNIKQNGEEFWIDLIIYPMFDENGIKVGYSSFRDDITDKKIIEYLSNHDPLTNLFNRRKAHEFLDTFKKAIDKNGELFSIIMFDIDFFKQVNDKYGHDIGDYVLIEISNLFLKELRKQDIFVRWGGEEFIIILPDTTKDEACNMAHHLKNSINSYYFETVEKITCSFGVSECNKDISIDELLKIADMKLYKSKKEGRDRVNC